MLHIISGFYGTVVNKVSMGFCLCRQSIINLQINMCKKISANHILTIFCFQNNKKKEDWNKCNIVVLKMLCSLNNIHSKLYSCCWNSEKNRDKKAEILNLY